MVEGDFKFIVNALQGQAVQLAGYSYDFQISQRILEHGARSRVSVSIVFS